MIQYTWKALELLILIQVIHNRKCKMRKWKIIYTIIFLVTIQLVQALDTCPDQIEITSNCTMITPSLNCTDYKYDIINSTDGIVLVDQENLSGFYGHLYQFNFTLGEGEYVVKLCDETVRQVKVSITKEEKARMYIATSIGLFAALAFFVFLTYHFRRDYDELGEYKSWFAPIRFVFITLAFYTVMALIRLGIELLRDTGKTGLGNVVNTLWVILVTTYGFLFFVIMFLYGLRFVWSIVERRRYGGA